MNLDVTSVTKSPEPYLAAPAAIDVITSEDIRRSGASSLPEALRLADNLDVAQKNSHDWAISARGFNTDLANKMLVMIDGRSIYTPLFSGVLWNNQDYLLEDVDRIEVISGPGSTLWGANAVNGVINIISKSAKDTQGTYLEAGGGTELQDFTGVRYGGMLSSNVFFRVYGKYFDRDNAVLLDGDTASDSWRMGQGGFRLDADASAQDTLTFQGDFYANSEKRPTGPDGSDNGNNLLGRWTHTFSEDSDMSLQAYYDRTHLYDPVPASAFAPAGVLVDDLDTYDVDFQNRFGLGEHNKIVWGLGYRYTHDVVKDAPGLGFDPETLDHNLFSGFVQDEIRLLDPLALTIGTKVEHNDYTGFEFEPSARLAWTPTEHQTFWGAVSRAIRAPSRVDRDERLSTPVLSGLGIDNLLVGGPDFESETLLAYELGYRAQLGTKLSASISAFYNQYDDVRSTGTNPPPADNSLLAFENNLIGHSYGVELSATYQILDWWRLHGGYDYLQERLHVKQGESDINHALNETADPKHQFSIRSSMDLGRNVDFDTTLRWLGAFRYNNGGTAAHVPAYLELNAALSWRPTKNLELSIVGQNLLHSRHEEYVISGANPGEDIQRAIYGKVTWRF